MVFNYNPGVGRDETEPNCLVELVRRLYGLVEHSLFGFVSSFLAIHIENRRKQYLGGALSAVNAYSSHN